MAQEYTIVRVDKKSISLGSYNIIKIINKNRSFYKKENIIIVKKDSLYQYKLYLIKYYQCLYLIKSLIKCLIIYLIGHYVRDIIAVALGSPQGNPQAALRWLTVTCQRHVPVVYSSPQSLRPHLLKDSSLSNLSCSTFMPSSHLPVKSPYI